MANLAQHIVIKTIDNRVLAPTVDLRRKLARTVLRISKGKKLLAMRCADTHLHLEPMLSRVEAGELVRHIEIGLHQQLLLPVRFAVPHFEPVDTQSHLIKTFRYILDQDKHHGCNVDPLHDASSLPDLLGLRVLDTDVIANVRSFLPRVNRSMLLSLLGDDLRQPITNWDQLGDAAAAACGLSRLTRSPASIQARRAGVLVAGQRLTAPKIAAELKCSERTVHSLRSQHGEPAYMKAVEQQLHLRQRVHSKTVLP